MCNHGHPQIHVLCSSNLSHYVIRSSTDLLTIIAGRVYQALLKNGEAQFVDLDIAKAFDIVWHTGLFHKLKVYGFPGRIFELIQSFLSNGERKVVLNANPSKFHSSTISNLIG